jgi:ribonuclease HII
MEMIMLLCGIDEAGRGPLAGDLVVAGVILKQPIKGLNDSKKLSEKAREKLFDQIIELSTYHIVSISPLEIDNLGLSSCMYHALETIKENIHANLYLFDGNTTFGSLGITTKVKADEEVDEVAAASILAKVTRDRQMKRVAKKYPLYGFENHKGYGTKAHIAAIKQYGYCDLHRKSYKVKGLN